MAAVTSSTSSSLALAGLASGINWTNIINDMAAAESAPITDWQNQQATLNTKNSAYQTIGTDLTNLENDANTLSSPSFFATATSTSSDNSVATASAASGTPLGSYTFSVSQMATAAVQNGTQVTAQPVSPDGNPADVTLDASTFATPITAGTFTVDGQTITVATTDTLQSVFDQINSATNGAVTASYANDEITLASNSPITLGSSADTSNFLEATQLYTNNTDSVTSLGPLAAINLNVPASQANLSTSITDGGDTDGGDGQGQFIINGVTIDYDPSTESINDILQAINNSQAGVTASYNGANNTFSLTNNSTGNLGITMSDTGAGNFLAAIGLSGGTFQAGTNLQYSLDGSPPITSESNTVDGTPLGLPGLSINAQSLGSTNITVSSDTNTIASAINSFVNDYNTIQNYITSQVTVSTSGSLASAAGSSTGTPGPLMGDMDVEGIATTLRQLVDASPLSGAIQNLNSLGILSNGNDNTLATSSFILSDSLANNLSQVSQLFTDPSNGIAKTVSSYLKTTLAGNGILSSNEKSFTSQYTALSTSITNLQTKISSDEAEMQTQFVDMEDAINSINVEKEYLTAYFNSSATSTDAPTAANSSSSDSSGSSSSASSS